MKTCTQLRKLFLFAVALLFTLNAKATWGDPPSIPLVNWSNEMGVTYNEGVCVILTENNHLYITLRIRVALDNLSFLPPIHVSYNFGDVLTGITSAIANEDLSPVTIGPFQYYQASFEFSIDLDDKCVNDPSSNVAPIIMDYSYSLVTPVLNGGMIIYPIADHTDCWPGEMFLENYNRNNLLPPIYSGSKKICCHQPDSDEQMTNNDELDPVADTEIALAATTSTGEAIALDRPLVPTAIKSRQLANGLVAHPNPVTEELNLSFYLPENGTISLQLLDNQGRMLRQQHTEYAARGEQSVQMSMADLPPGVYYVYLQTAISNEVSKIIKLNE